MSAKNWREVVLHFYCIAMVELGYINYYLILNQQDDSGEIKGRKEKMKSTSSCVCTSGFTIVQFRKRYK